eukprot:15475053-Alexandrium_andersonii.AAC.1
MCGGPGPQQAIWEMTVFVTAALCVAAQVPGGRPEVLRQGGAALQAASSRFGRLRAVACTSS